MTSLSLPNRRRFISLAALLCVFAFVYLPEDIELYISRNLRVTAATSATSTPPKDTTPTLADDVTAYDQNNIIATAKHFPKFAPRLLVFDGSQFKAYGIIHKDVEYYDGMKYNYRYSNTVPLLVRSLKQHFPERFRPGQPVFEMLFTDADSSNSDCVNHKNCPVDTFAPIILFGTSPKDGSVFPTLKNFPFSTFCECLYEYKINGRDTCVWPQKVNSDLQWDDLIHTITWRGSDYPFLSHHKQFDYMGPWTVKDKLEKEWKSATKEEILTQITTKPLSDEFSPRWRAAIQSVIAENDDSNNTTSSSSSTTVPWIDSRFTAGMSQDVRDKLAAEKGIRVNGDRMSAFEMSKYKYQIDLGGGGGTTWEGTIAKLQMPGVLFHHETPNKDWFYDLMVPWKHYVPVRLDLKDLHAKYLIAEKDPIFMEKIAGRATKLAKYIMSKEYMDKIYQELFVDFLGKLVNMYQPTGSWEDMEKNYASNGYEMFTIATCDNDVACTVYCRKDEPRSSKMINLKKVPSDKGIFDSSEEATAITAATA